MGKTELDSVAIQKIGRANRVRFTCAGIVWVFYFGFTLAYAGVAGFFAESVSPGSLVTGTIAYFYFLIFLSLSVEYVIMRFRASDEASSS
jgi:hypothetical protein